MSKNIFGETIATCGTDPTTGFYRDGCCNTGPSDQGTHTVCAVVTSEFLEYSKKQGNDLMTARPEFEFPGLKEGDRWCVCASRWLEAYHADVAPTVVLEATNIKTLDIIPMELLIQHAHK